MSEQNQEPRCERVTVAVTEREKRAVQFLALLEDTTESEIIRRYPLGSIVDIADARRAKAQEPAEIEAAVA